MALSTSDRISNILAAVAAARGHKMTTWALLTGRRLCPLVDQCHDAVCADASAIATVQEIYQVIIRLLCAAADREVLASPVLPSTEELPDEESAG